MHHVGNRGQPLKEIQQLSARLEDYIEAIYHIIAEKRVARGKDIVNHLGVSGSSVTRALHALSTKGLINYAPYEYITLTAAGRVIAEDVVHRHAALKSFLTEVLAVDDAVAEMAACEIEHIAPREIITRIVAFIRFIETYPGKSKDLTRKFTEFYKPDR